MNSTRRFLSFKTVSTSLEFAIYVIEGTFYLTFERISSHMNSGNICSDMLPTSYTKFFGKLIFLKLSMSHSNSTISLKLGILQKLNILFVFLS